MNRKREKKWSHLECKQFAKLYANYIISLAMSVTSESLHHRNHHVPVPWLSKQNKTKKYGGNKLSLFQCFPICHSLEQGNINVQLVSSFHILLMYWKVFRTLLFLHVSGHLQLEHFSWAEQYGLLLRKAQWADHCQVMLCLNERYFNASFVKQSCSWNEV